MTQQKQAAPEQADPATAKRKHPMKNTTVTIPADTMNALKIEAAARGCTVGAVVLSIVEAHVSK